MKLGRRKFLAWFGIGAAATPVAAPAFGRAIVQQQASRGATKGLGSLGSMIGENAGYVSDAPEAPMSNMDILKLIGGGWKEKQEEARNRLEALEQNMEHLYALSSWSPAFRHYMSRTEYDKRRLEYRSISEKIRDLIQGWWKNNPPQQPRQYYEKDASSRY